MKKFIARRSSLVAYLLVAGLFLSACNSDRKEALSALEKAKVLYGNAEYSMAKQVLDELKTQYSKEVEVLKEALHLTRQIEKEEQERNLLFCDSLLQIKQAATDSLRAYFVFEKNPEYDVTGRYIERKAAASASSRRLQTGIHEDGNIYLKSVYCGKGAIRHNQLKVSIPDGEYAQTEAVPFDGGANYTFVDGNTGLTHEIVTYQNGRDNGVIQFIYNYSTQKLIAQYTGGKVYSFTLTAAEIESLVKTVEFSLVLSDIQKLQKEKTKAKERIKYLQEKLTVALRDAK
jgi:prepilin-type processing-associated H-X9-DG protein